VVRDGLAAFAANRSLLVHGTRNYFVSLISRWTSRRFTARVSERVMRPKNPTALGRGAVPDSKIVSREVG